MQINHLSGKGFSKKHGNLLAALFLILVGCGAGGDTQLALVAQEEELVAGEEEQLTTFALAVSTVGTGTGTVTSSPTGINCGMTKTACQASFDDGTVVTLTATASGDSTFARWGGSCTGTANPITLTMTLFTSCSAIFDLVEFTLTVTMSGTGTGTVTSNPVGIICGTDCKESYPSGTAVGLAAVADSGSTFVGWSGDADCLDGDVTMNASKTCTATFAPLFTLTVTLAGNGSGTVTSSPTGVSCAGTCAASFVSGTSITLTASASQGSAFAEFSGGCISVAVTCSLTITGNTTVTATFTPLFTLTVTAAGTGTGTVISSPTGIACGTDCVESYVSGKTVTLTATPSSGSIFSGWSGGGCIGTGGCTVTMTANTSVTATFDLLIISGKARFEKKIVDQTGLTNTIVLTPIRSADVEIYRDGDGVVVATGDTDANGDFSIEIPEAEVNMALKVRVIARQLDGNLNVRVVDALDETVFPNAIIGFLYAAYSEVVTGPQSDVQITATADDATGRRAGAFNIFDAFISATDFVQAVGPSAVFPPIVFRWKVGTDIGPTFLPDAVTIAEGVADRINIGDKASDTNDFDDSIILHEIGHYMGKNFSKDSSQGGPHLLGQRLDPRLAFSEGWADFFAQAVVGDPLYINSTSPSPFTVSVESFNATTMATTYESELAVAQVIWDLFDTGTLSTDGDTLNLGFAPIWDAFVALKPNYVFVYLHDILDVLKTQGQITATDINDNFCVVGGPEVCDPPWNARLSTTQSVIFPQFVIGSNDLLIWSVNAGLGQTTLAAASDFYLLELSTAGTLTVQITVDFPVFDNLDLYIFEDDQGRTLDQSVTASGNETVSVFLDPGLYMIQVSGFYTLFDVDGFIPYLINTTFTP